MKTFWLTLAFFLFALEPVLSQIDTLNCPPFSDRNSGSVFPSSQCPAYYLEKYKYVNLFTPGAPNASNISFGFYTDLNGTMGYCGTPPLQEYGQNIAPGINLTYLHHIEIIVPVPWCFNALLFAKCGVTAGANDAYPNYFGPAFLFNERPLQANCRNIYGQSGNASFYPNNIPLWDMPFQGSTTLGTIRLAVNDSCAYNSTLQRSMMSFEWILTNGTVLFPNGSGNAPEFVNNITNTTSAGNYFYGAYGLDTVGGTSGSWCENGCDTFVQPFCNDTNRTFAKRTTFRPRTIVSLACRDSGGFGLVFRVDNLFSPNVHCDWFLYDQIQGNGTGFPLPVCTNVSVINSSLWDAPRNVGYNDQLFNGFWPGITGKRRAGASQYFYIPTYLPNSTVTPTSYAADMFDRPTILDFYAAYPSHYVGSTILAGIVDFFPMRTTLNMAAFIEFNQSIVGTQSAASNCTFRDKNVTTTVHFNVFTMDFWVVKDFERQVILTVCTNSANLTATLIEIVNITNVTGWTDLCNHINNNSKTWSQTLNMLYTAFPGLLPSNVSDPIPTCNCSDTARSPCGDSTSGLPSMMTIYSPEVIPLVVNASTKAVCRITNSMLNLINYTLAGQGFVIFIYNATNISNGDYGYVWSISNLNVNSSVQEPGLSPEYVTTQNDLYVKWAFGNYTPPNGNASSTYPLPYPFPDGLQSFTDTNGTVTKYATHDTTIRSGTTRFFWSLTSDPHKMYGTFQAICNTSGPCTYTFPFDPPTLPDPNGWSIAYNATELAALPNCTCGVNVPCQLQVFLFSINTDLNLSSLEILPDPPLPPLQYNIVYPVCIPQIEQCNGIDDDCDGIIDNIKGFNMSCYDIPGLNGTGVCTSGSLGCPPYGDMIPPNVNFTANPELIPVYQLITYTPICFGAILPTGEICNLLDDNCDGIVDNIVPAPCGNFVLGTCKRGISTCVAGVFVCVGQTDPIPEICGDGLDNDCNGVIDNGCPTQGSTKIVLVMGNGKNNNNKNVINRDMNGLRNSILKILKYQPSRRIQYDRTSSYIVEVPNEVKDGEQLVTVLGNDIIGTIVDFLVSVQNVALAYVITLIILCFCICLCCAIGPFGACSTLFGFLPVRPWIPMFDPPLPLQEEEEETQETQETQEIEEEHLSEPEKQESEEEILENNRNLFDENNYDDNNNNINQTSIAINQSSQTLSARVKLTHKNNTY